MNRNEFLLSSVYGPFNSSGPNKCRTQRQTFFVRSYCPEILFDQKHLAFARGRYTLALNRIEWLTLHESCTVSRLVISVSESTPREVVDKVYPTGYNQVMRVQMTEVYRDWINTLKDRAGRARIQVRVDRLVHGNPGQHRNLTDGVSELKIDFGPGYRLYYTKRRGELVILLAGGDKTTQQQDIKTAIALAKNL